MGPWGESSLRNITLEAAFSPHQQNYSSNTQPLTDWLTLSWKQAENLHKTTICFWMWPWLCCVVDAFNSCHQNFAGPLICMCACKMLLLFVNGCQSGLSSHHYNPLPQDSWEIVEGLRGGFGSVLEPQKQEGYMLKRRKWPMKGWHKV